MKGITGNPALDAYQRMAVSPVAGVRPSDRLESGPQGGAPTEAAQVTLSAAARTLAAESAPSDPAKLEELRAKLDDKTYSVNPSAIAKKLLDEAF